MTEEDEKQLNDVGDKFAELLGVKQAGVDHRRRKLWLVGSGKKKTGMGLIRMSENFISKEVANLEALQTKTAE